MDFKAGTDQPERPGWYVARMKTWAADNEWEIVRVDEHTSSDGQLVVWQVSDERRWPIDAWLWRGQITVSMLGSPSLKRY